MQNSHRAKCLLTWGTATAGSTTKGLQWESWECSRGINPTFPAQATSHLAEKMDLEAGQATDWPWIGSDWVSDTLPWAAPCRCRSRRGKGMTAFPTWPQILGRQARGVVWNGTSRGGNWGAQPRAYLPGWISGSPSLCSRVWGRRSTRARWCRSGGSSSSHGGSRCSEQGQEGHRSAGLTQINPF